MSIRLNGSTSGYTEIDAPAVAGSNTIVLPTGNGSANQLLKNGSTAGSLEFSNSVYIDSSQRLLVGTSSARSNFFNSSFATSIQLETSSTTGRGLSVANTVNSDASSIFILAKSRGSSVGSTGIVSSGDHLSTISFQGDDGTEFVDAARIECYVDGTPGANDMPGRLVLSTTADGASSPTERMRISNNGTLTCQGMFDQTTANAANVQVDANGVVRRSTSSAKYKTDIETVQDSYADAILNVRPVWYRSTCEADCPDHSYWGFIAEEVAQIDKRLVHWKTVDVTYDENGAAVSTPCDPEPEGVQYDRFVPHLLNLIKRQGEAIAELQAEVAALKGA
jgi:hypothetical protein